MPKLTSVLLPKDTGVKPKDLKRVALKLGFVKIRQTGSHVQYKNAKYNKHITIVENGKKVQNDVLKILREIEYKEASARNLSVTKENPLIGKNIVIKPSSDESTTRPTSSTVTPDKPSLGNFVAPGNNWYEWVKNVRKASKLAQTSVAELIGITGPTLSNIENGNSTFNETTFKKWVDLFEIKSCPHRVPTNQGKGSKAAGFKVKRPYKRKNFMPPLVTKPKPLEVAPVPIPEIKEPIVAPVPISRREIIERAGKILNNPGLSDGQAKLLVAILRANAGVILGI